MDVSNLLLCWVCVGAWGSGVRGVGSSLVTTTPSSGRRGLKPCADGRGTGHGGMVNWQGGAAGSGPQALAPSRWPRGVGSQSESQSLTPACVHSPTASCWPQGVGSEALAMRLWLRNCARRPALATRHPPPPSLPRDQGPCTTPGAAPRAHPKPPPTAARSTASDSMAPTTPSVPSYMPARGFVRDWACIGPVLGLYWAYPIPHN